jgi:GntR family transcriptional regulator
VNVEIDRLSATPPWRQVADELRRMITSGEIAAGRPIPSKRTARETWDIAGATYDKAVGLLKAEGLIAPTHGMGLYVVERPD